MILPLTQEIITTGFLSKLSTQVLSLKYYLICGYEFKSSYKSCGYSSNHETRRLNSIAKNGWVFEKISLNWIQFWKFMAFRMLRKQAMIAVHHGKTTLLTLGSLLYTHQEGRHKVWLDNLQLPSSHVPLSTAQKLVCTRISRAYDERNMLEPGLHSVKGWFQQTKEDNHHDHLK